MSKISKFQACLAVMMVFFGFASAQQTASIPSHDLKLRSLLTKKIANQAAPQDTAANANAVKPELTLEGYVDAYYMFSSDSNSYVPGAIQQFTSIGPKVNQFGLNVVRLRSQYTSKNIRGTISMFWGDIPKYSWSQETNSTFAASYNAIQEANVGVKITKGLWFDAGFFTTHIGTELLMPKDNLMSSISFVTYHEPFYMSGAILTWEPTSKLTAKLVLANDYYNFANPRGNGNKAVGLLLTYKPTDYIAVTYNNIFLNLKGPQDKSDNHRFYNNINVSYNKKRLQLQAGVDFGYQHNVFFDSLTIAKDAFFITGLGSAKYRFAQKMSVFGRFEFFNDKNGAISAHIQNTSTGKMQGLLSTGYTFGGEYNPASNCYLRIEGRFINSDSNQLWYKKSDGNLTYQRLEGLLTFGVNFSSGNLIR